MATTYTECGEKVEVVAGKLLERFYRDLVEAGVTISFLFADNPTAIGGPLKKNGLPVGIKCKVNRLQDRVEGKKDATIVISQEWWDQHSETECTAAIDQCLYSLLLAHDDEGKPELDDAGRPCLTIRVVDFRAEGYHDIAKRHGKDSLEVTGVIAVTAHWQQLQFDFSAWG